MDALSSAVRAKLVAVKLGVSARRRAKALGLSFNPDLGAYNVFEIPVDPAVIEAAQAVYRQHVAPRLDEPGSFESSDGLAFYIKRPPYASDIVWYSGDNEQTYRIFEAEFFTRMRLENPFAKLVDCARGLRLYCGFFVVRSHCQRSQFHQDFDWVCGTNVYTLMTPLQDFSASREGHLAYADPWGRRRIYRYRMGTAIVFGTGFIHATQPVASGPPRAFLSFIFGSDKEQYWPAVLASIHHTGRLLCEPGGALMRTDLP